MTYQDFFPLWLDTYRKLYKKNPSEEECLDTLSPFMRMRVERKLEKARKKELKRNEQTPRTS